MVVGEVVNVSSGLVLEVGKLALWAKAAGIAVLLWVLFEAIALYLNWKRWKSIGKIMEDMKRLERKLDRAIKKL
jgi:hypothetical protein